MGGRVRGASWRAAILAIAAIGVVTFGGSALAGHMTSDVKSYTGCLVPKDGVVIKVKQGDSPAGPCTAGMTQVHLSGGDIAKITVTGGLTGGGGNGEVTIGLDPKYGLPQGCATGEVAKWSSSTSSWACAADSNTTYSASTGLDLSSANAFSIEPDYRVKNTPDCTSGQFATGFDSSGTIECAPPAPSGVVAYSAHVGVTTLAGDTLVISKDIPAGTYLLFASVALINQDGNDGGDGESEARCRIPGYDTGSVDLVWGDVETARTKVSVALSSAITHGGGAVELRCEENAADVDVWNATLTAIRVGTLG